MEWLETNQIKVPKPKKTKKVTGTRFASILGLNAWSTPFEMWCAITKTYEKPFEDTKYTLAGKAIEPKQAAYMKRSYGMNIITPTDIYGKDFFKKTYGDFFPENKHFGGMFDFLEADENGNTIAVLEMKTTKRAEDWSEDVPEYYAEQAALYAYLKGVDQVYMVASFLEDSDYDHPENYECKISNTIVVPFKVSERYPQFDKLVAKVEKWWKDYVETGISPVFDEKKDEEILKALRTNSLNPTTNIDDLIKKAESLQAELDAESAKFKEKEDELKNIKDQLKEYSIKQFRSGDKNVTLSGTNYVFTTAKYQKADVDKKALEKDGLLNKYTKVSEQYKLTVKAKEEK
jgi:predicted phage-related endonuclease